MTTEEVKKEIKQADKNAKACIKIAEMAKDSGYKKGIQEATDKLKNLRASVGRSNVISISEINSLIFELEEKVNKKW
jgi:hypothetical protein